MAGERRINFGADATDARYRIEDTGDGANLVLAEDLDGGTVLLEYDDSRTPSEWVVRGPVDLDGNDLSAGAIDATSVTTDEVTSDSGVTESRVAPWMPVIEDWHRETLSYYGGDTDSYGFDTTNPLEGDAALINISDGAGYLRSPFQAARGFKYRINLYFATHDTQDIQIAYIGLPNTINDTIISSDGYLAWVSPSESDTIRLSRIDGGVDNGITTDLATSSASIPTETWLSLDISLGFDTISASVTQIDGSAVGDISASDRTYSGLYLQPRLRDALGENNKVDIITRRPL